MTKTISMDEIKGKLAPLFDEEGLGLLLLFGSAVSGKTHKRSDIDLAFLFEKPADILAITNKVTRLLHCDNVEVVDLRRAGPLLRYAAARNGRVLYERRKGVFNRFYSLALRMYVDSKKLRDADKTVIHEYLRAKGLS